MLNSEVDDLQEWIHRHIPYAFQYACEHWADHLGEITVDRNGKMEVDSLLEVFAKRTLLFWIEVMGLLGKAKEAVLLVRSAKTWVTVRGVDARFDPSLLPLLRDAERFVMEYMDVIHASSLHTYISALAIAPVNSQIRSTYGNLISAGPNILKGGDTDWSNYL
ncbi:hypothetical protein FRB94_008444 [Tulasnella sp. JGI-2019a]|nr:hypothetical protein FRB94_008444 [Tulasnella sp. JGI-2019a]KAG8999152.1 hypothetical protein FRB93_013309 [Tulasnella sp. JGI-2019a]KAG9030687.1 hypothetical protein FRB95_003648 [Tulasnella sp. JGI-2019a]